MNTYKLKAFLSGKQIAILGLGISNRPLLRMLADWGLNITCFDQLPADHPSMLELREEFKDARHKLSFCLGDNYLENLQGFDVIFKTPHFRPDHPALVKAHREGAIITSEIEIFMALCPCPIIGVTGSDGKTTTSTLIAKLLEKEKRRVHLGGNIGKPLCDQLDRIKADDLAVLELSSFQLMSMSSSADIALITNVTPNHLDFHRDFAEYKEAKQNIYRHQTLFGQLIVNGSDPAAVEFANEARGELIWIKQRALPSGKLFAYDQDVLYYQERPDSERKELCKRADVKLLGQHNLTNLLMAYAACHDKVSTQSLRDLAREFTGVDHRMQYIAKIGDVKIYNSSIDSSPSRSIVTLKAFAEQGVVTVPILGGQDKNLDYRDLGLTLVRSSRAAVIWGSNQELIAEAIEQAKQELGIEFSYDLAGNYEVAIKRALTYAQPGEAIILTPAGTSFDHFKNYLERGNLFTQVAKKLQSELAG